MAEKATKPEIEITPEMMEAGLAAFARYDYRFDMKEDAVRDIFCSMVCMFKEGVDWTTR